jgi:hypothetical protein
LLFSAIEFIHHILEDPLAWIPSKVNTENLLQEAECSFPEGVSGMK